MYSVDLLMEKVGDILCIMMLMYIYYMYIKCVYYPKMYIIDYYNINWSHNTHTQLYVNSTFYQIKICPRGA